MKSILQHLCHSCPTRLSTNKVGVDAVTIPLRVLGRMFQRRGEKGWSLFLVWGHRGCSKKGLQKGLMSTKMVV